MIGYLFIYALGLICGIVLSVMSALDKVKFKKIIKADIYLLISIQYFCILGKLVNLIQVSWWMVLIPIWVLIGVLCLCFLAFCLVDYYEKQN